MSAGGDEQFGIADAPAVFERHLVGLRIEPDSRRVCDKVVDQARNIEVCPCEALFAAYASACIIRGEHGAVRIRFRIGHHRERAAIAGIAQCQNGADRCSAKAQHNDWI